MFSSGTSSAGATRLSSLIAPHLPGLRRYTRALSGSQQIGDGYVVSVLQRLVENPDGFDRSIDARVSLYRYFHRNWLGIENPPSPLHIHPADMSGLACLAKLTPQARRALLLVSIENFTEEETALILDTDKAEITKLLEQARADIAKQPPARVMIIEDEPVIALDIESIVNNIGHEVVGVVNTHAAAVACAKETHPDLVLADIQLADGSSGIEAVADIITEMPVCTIFITAYPERLLTGKRVEPTFLIAKPFRPESIEAAITQALFSRCNGAGNT